MSDVWVVVWEQVWRHWHGDCASSQGLWHDRHRTTEVHIGPHSAHLIHLSL
jgi:hypothetical protein